MIAATVTDWAALHRDLADVYARHGRPDDAQVHRQLSALLEEFRYEAWESYVADALLLVEED